MDAHSIMVRHLLEDSHYTNAYYHIEDDIIFLYCRKKDIPDVNVWVTDDMSQYRLTNFKGELIDFTQKIADDICWTCFPTLSFEIIPKHFLTQEMILASKIS